MPPKKKGGGKKGGGGGGAAAKKADAARRQKLVEDKTFGMKNKNKSKRVQRYVQEVKIQAGVGQTQQDVRRAYEERQAQKRAAEEAALMAELNRPVIQAKVPVGVDPKSRICEYFKRGQCKKGSRCKFSHDLSIARKSDKRSIYQEKAAAEKAEKEADTMDNWDQEKLEQVVEKKRDGTNRNLKTKIVCRNFIAAIEENKYGWFWNCPNGKGCQYVHALPPDYVFKQKKADSDDEEDEEPLEDILEAERAKLTTHTPLTLETFLAWKAKKKAEADAAATQREKDAAAGKVKRSGREMYEHDKSVFVDDADAATDVRRADSSDDDENVATIEVTATSLVRKPDAAKAAAAADPEATPAGDDGDGVAAAAAAAAAADAQAAAAGAGEGKGEEEEEAAAAPAAAAAAPLEGIDEDLFDDADLLDEDEE